jgi:hypothetical protein
LTLPVPVSAQPATTIRPSGMTAMAWDWSSLPAKSIVTLPPDPNEESWAPLGARATTRKFPPVLVG